METRELILLIAGMLIGSGLTLFVWAAIKDKSEEAPTFHLQSRAGSIKGSIETFKKILINL